MTQYTILAVCRPALGRGFRLAGVPVIEATDADAAAVACAERRAPDVGLVLIEQELLDAMKLEDRRQLSRAPLPILVPFPGSAWQTDRSRAEAYVAEILRQAIGYRVRLQ
jgi:vacuolar-type H+-ATPase subunit F/Vma7